MVKTIFHDTSYVEYEYNGAGIKVLEYSQIMPGHEAERVKTKFDFDANGRLKKVANDFEGPDQIETSYEYDEVGNKVKQIDPNKHVTTWVYDDLGRVKKHTLPGGEFESFDYYPNGTVDKKTDFNGDVIDYTYYPCCGRLHRKTYEDRTFEEYTYTGTGRIDTFRNRLGEITDSDYDFRGRLRHVSKPSGNDMDYAYYPNGSIHTVSSQSETTINTYDDLNRLATVTASGKQTTYTYYDSGLRHTVTHSNGTTTTYGHNTLNRLRTIENRDATGNLISGHTYTLAPDGNRTRVDELPNLRAEVYKYDRLNRLTGEEILDPTNGNETISYTYDNFANRITKTDAEKTIVYTYDDNDRLRHEIGPDHLVSYQYDDNGNTIEKFDGENTTTYGYDPENRLVTARTPEHYLEYQYDMDGIRVASAVDGVLTRYTVDKNRDYAQVLEERDADGNLIVSYVYGDDLISQNRNGVESWYHYDGQMSTRQLTDSEGNVTDTYTYDAFGVLRNRTGATINNHMYTGEQYDPNAGFYYLRARWMSMDSGRFITVDPWEGDTNYSISMHKYLYANTNPMMFVDPTGKYSQIDISIANSIRELLSDMYLDYGMEFIGNNVHRLGEDSEKQFFILTTLGIGIGICGIAGRKAFKIKKPNIKSLNGKSIRWIKKQKPRGWRTSPTRDNEGFIWTDENGVERLRFMRGTGRNPANNQWSRQSNGYFRWKNERDEYLDADGNVVSRSDPLFEEKTHIPYEGL